MQIKLKKLPFIVFISTTFFLMLYRISIHADIYDEIINLSISYRIALGDVPFYNCWEAFQSGDIFLAPFIWIYIKIFHTTSGLILYSRLIYITVLTGVSVVTYFSLHKYISKIVCFHLSYIIIFFQLYSLFYLWYDSVSVIFFLLGNLLILNGLESRKGVSRLLFFWGAGIIHCGMAFSYPAFVVLAIFMALTVFFVSHIFYRHEYRKAFCNVLWYGSGALMFIIALLTYFQLTVGLSNVFATIKLITQTRGTNNISILNILRDIIVAYVNVNRYFIPITLLIGIVYFKALKDRRYILPLLFSIIILPIFNQIFIGANTLMGLANYLSYLALWCPFLYYLIEKKRIIEKCLMYIFFIPSALSTVLISTTTVYADIGPVKCWQACLPGALAALFYMIVLWKDLPKGELYSKLALKIVVITLIINSFSYIYLNQPYIGIENKRMFDGLYWGIKVNNEMERLIEIQNLVIPYSFECETVLAGGRLRPIYLMTDMKPYSWSVEAPCYYQDGIYKWDIALEYFEYFEAYPDVMFIEPYEAESDEIKKILKKYYQMKQEAHIGSYDICVYQKK